eukprot:5309455-Amphidinium_carterae.2
MKFPLLSQALSKSAEEPSSGLRSDISSLALFHYSVASISITCVTRFRKSRRTTNRCDQIQNEVFCANWHAGDTPCLAPRNALLPAPEELKPPRNAMLR